MAAPEVIQSNLPQPKSPALERADALIRAAIEAAEPLAYRLAREWPEGRSQAMQNLTRKTQAAADWLETLMESETIIAYSTAMIGSLRGLQRTASQQLSSSSRVWGRSYIRECLEYLEEKFGNGCELSPLTKLIEKEPARVTTKEPNLNSSLPEFLSPADVAKILRVDRRTVVRQFENYPGVIDVTLNEKKKFHLRRTLRIPRGVLLRFIEQHRVR